MDERQIPSYSRNIQKFGLGGLHRIQTILWSALALATWYEVELNGNSIIILSALPIDLKIDDCNDILLKVKFLKIDKFVRKLYIRRGITTLVNPQGDTNAGMVQIFSVAEKDDFKYFLPPIEYLPCYGHIAQDTWLAAAGSMEVALDCSLIAPNGVILTHWACTIGAAALIRNALIKWVGVGASRCMFRRIDLATAAEALGTASNFNLDFPTGLWLPPIFEYHLIGTAPVGNTACLSTFEMKII